MLDLESDKRLLTYLIRHPEEHFPLDRIHSLINRVQQLETALEAALRYVPAHEGAGASRQVWLDGIATLKAG